MGENSSETPSRIFQMAKDYEEKEKVCNAINLYKKLMSKHTETKEAALSRKSFIRIASDYVKEGKNHKAIALYNDISKTNLGT